MVTTQLGSSRIPAYPTPLWAEGRAIIEFITLRFEPAFYGWGVKRGRGDPCILVPGYLHGVATMGDLFLWLGRIGHPTYEPGFGRNVGCPDTLRVILADRILEVYQRTEKPVTIIGHSLGGVLAISAALSLSDPSIVKLVVTMGSPLSEDVEVHDFVSRFVDLDRRIGAKNEHCQTLHCDCELAQKVRGGIPRHLKTFHYYTETDGVVHWRRTLNLDAQNHLVHGSHSGLPVNRELWQDLHTRLTA